MKEFIVSHNGIAYYSKVREPNVVKEMSELRARQVVKGAVPALLCRNSTCAGMGS